jgi:MFS family permease
VAATISYLPSLLFGVVAGFLVDRWNRRRVMIWADAGRAVLLGAGAALLARDALGPAHLVAIAFGVSTSAVFFYPARDSILPEIASPGRLIQANAAVQLSQQAAFFMGPLATGVLIQSRGIAAALPAGACCFVGSLLCLATMRGAGDRTRAGSAPGEALEGFRQGLAAIARDRTLLLLLALTALDNLFIMGPAVVGTAVLVRETLSGDAAAYALVEATYGVGMILGSLTVARVGSRWGDGRLLLTGILLDGLTYVPLVACRSLPFLLAVSLVHSFVIPVITVPRATILQRIVPRKRLGRIFALVNVVVVGMTALSSGLTGIALERLSAPALFGAIGVMAAATGALGLCSRRLRAL